MKRHKNSNCRFDSQLRRYPCGVCAYVAKQYGILKKHRARKHPQENEDALENELWEDALENELREDALENDLWEDALENELQGDALENEP